MSILSENLEHDVEFITMLAGFCTGDPAYQDIFINYFKQYGLEYAEAVDSCFICFEQCIVDGEIKYKLNARKPVNDKVCHEVYTPWWSTHRLQRRGRSRSLFHQGLGCDVVHPIPEHLFNLIWDWLGQDSEISEFPKVTEVYAQTVACNSVKSVPVTIFIPKTFFKP